MEIGFKSNDETLLATLYGSSSVGVVLCPPHPLYGGSRKDTRIVKVAKELDLHNISALCIDYGSYNRGVKEVQNVLDAIAFMRKRRVDSLGLLGYSFGAVVASNAAARSEIDGFVAMSILRKVNGLEAKLDFSCPKLLVHGVRDDIASYSEFERLYEEAREAKKLVLDTDHFYMEDYPTTIDLVSQSIREFFSELFFHAI